MKKFGYLLVGTSLGIFHTAAFTQNIASPGSAGVSNPNSLAPVSVAQAAEVGEIVVTAEKRSERLSKTPVAISVVSQGKLDSLSITSPQALVSTVLNLQTSVNGYTVSFGMRGVSNFSGSYSVVATQVDGIYQPSTASLSNGLYDVGSIEILRGPQGTIYGRNATAGVVNINTADPTRHFEAFGDVAVGNYSDLTTRAVINVPISDALQVRASVVRQRNDGYYDGGAAPRNYAKAAILTARLVALAQITDRLTWRLAFEHADNTGTINYLQAINYLYYPNFNATTGALGAPVIVPARSNLFNQESEPDNGIDVHSNALRSRLNWSLGDKFNISYLAGYSRSNNNGIGSATGVFRTRSRNQILSSNTQEVDLNFTSDRLKAVAGIYYYHDQSHGDSALHIGNTVPSPLSGLVPNPMNNPTGNEPSSYGLIDIVQHTKSLKSTSKAAFGQATFSVTSGLRLTGGIRYTDDSTSTNSSSQVCAFGTGTVPNAALQCGVPFGPPSTTIQSTSSNNTSWKTSADFDLDANNLLYATISTGYRGGGVSGNTRLPAAFLSYGPETATNYEAGWKGQFFNRTLSISLDAFTMDYKNMQVSAIEHDLLGNPTPVTINAGASRVRGVEGEFAWRFTPHDELTGFATYLDARFTKFPNAVNASTNPDGIYNTNAALAGLALLPTNVPTDFSGNRLPNSAKVTARLSYSHIFDLAGGATITPSAQVYWQGRSYGDLANSPQGVIKSYSKTDLNLTYKSPSGLLTINAYVHNLENKTAYQATNSKWDDTQGFYMPPRTYGVRVGLRYR
jgi:iron complex outermembrane receptor protein